MKNYWNLMTEEEREYSLDNGHNEEEVNGATFEEIVGFLKFMYAVNGKTLHDVNMMIKRLQTA